MIRWPSRTLIVSALLFLVEARKEKCEYCSSATSCSFYGNLSKAEQERWVARFECPRSEGTGPLDASSATGDLVCCPNSIWGTNTNDNEQKAKDQTTIRNAQYNYNPSNRGDSTPNYNRPDNNGFSNRPGNNGNTNRPIDNNNDPAYEPQRLPHHHHHHHHTTQPYNQENWAPGLSNNGNNQNFGGNDNTFGGNQNSYGQNGNYNPSNGNSFGGNGNNFDRNGNQYGDNGNAFNGNANGNGFDGNSNNFGGNGNNFNRNRNTFGANGNSFGGNGNSNIGNQCPVTSYPPDPQSGCCGREASDSDRITVKQPGSRRNEQRRTERPWKSPMDDYRNWNSQSRFKRQAPNVTVDNRIAGGRETELDQFPWTVLLKTTFDYGTSESAFNCGGSLISSYYVLTAGHCVVEENARIKDIEIYLAEYDKRTFPRDCKNVIGKGRKCVENIIMKAEDVIPHPNYDNDRLFNDIALIKMQRPAPYTEYIRPICLPPINVDEPDFFNLRLAVAGWGRNGKYKSDIKQSTVVNLVPNRECKRYYPNLSKSQLCAAGYSGEDTCKGDSGGPLMLLYEGKYFVSGVVSGKRADAPCGTSVPSLYTNVYQHSEWIRRNIRN